MQIRYNKQQIIPLTLVVLTLAIGSPPLKAGMLNLEDGLALKGYDPVAYAENKALKGNPAYTATLDGAHYYFSTETNKQRFLAAPSSFLPEYGGFCAFAMLKGDKVDINPRRFKRISGKLYFFYDGFFGNTLDKWNQLCEREPESDLICKADQQWNTCCESSTNK